MAESEAPGDARLDDPVDHPVDGDSMVGAPTGGDWAEPPASEWVAPPPLDPEPRLDVDGRPFNAFDEDTWHFTPAPSPWYRTGHSRIVLLAVVVAVIALVVSVVLLAFRGAPRDDGVPAPAPTSTAPTTATAPPVTSALVPPPPPPPPPPPAASEIQRQAPAIVREQPTRKPEINVTRSPLSVSPQMPKRR